MVIDAIYKAKETELRDPIASHDASESAFPIHPARSPLLRAFIRMAP